MNKLSAIWLLGIMVFFSGHTPVSAGTGDLQVTCESGVRIFIDDDFMGVSKGSEGGLFISDLTPGAHTLKVIKKGFDAYKGEVVIKEFEAVEVKIKFTKIAEKIIQVSPESGEAAAQVGVLELRSAPMGAAVFVDGEKKSGKTDMRIENIGVGQHTISFTREGQNLSGEFIIVPDGPLVLKADFKNGVISNISELKKNELEKERKRLKAAEVRQPQGKTEELEKQQLKGEEQGQQIKAAEVRQPLGKTEELGKQQMKGEEKGQQTEQPVISEAAKPYGELCLEVAVIREASSPSYRDHFFVKFPNNSIPNDDLLDPHFRNSDRTDEKEGVRYLSDSTGRVLSSLIVSRPRQPQGREFKGNAINAIVKEGNYTLYISRKRWEVSFTSDKKMPDKEAVENIVIKRGSTLHVKLRYTIDKNRSDEFNYAIERSDEALSKNFNEKFLSSLKK